MKILTLTLGLLISAHSFAGTKKILCQEDSGISMGAFSLGLDNSQIQQGSGYFRIRSANWGFAYSSAGAMNCSDTVISLSGTENFKCVGYANGQWLMEITVELKKGKGFAKVHNLDDNIYAGMTEGMVLPCQIEGL